MVRRGSDEPRSLGDRLDQLEQRVADLGRTIGYGTSVLRDSTGASALRMAAEAPHPTLSPDDIDSAVHFNEDGTARFASEDGKSDRAWSASGLTMTRTPDSYNAPQLVAVTQDVGIVFYAGRAYSSSPSNADGRDMNARVYYYPNGSMPSERSLKRELGALPDPRAVLDAIDTGRFVWLDPDAPGRDDLEHHGLFVDDALEAVAPALVVRYPDGTRSPDERALITYLIARGQQRDRELDELRARVSARQQGPVRRALRWCRHLPRRRRSR